MKFNVGNTVFYITANTVCEGEVSNYDEKNDIFVVDSRSYRGSYVFIKSEDLFGTTQAAGAHIFEPEYLK